MVIIRLIHVAVNLLRIVTNLYDRHSVAIYHLLLFLICVQYFGVLVENMC